MASYLTVGEVAALINVAILITQLTYPLLLSFIIAGLVNKHLNAATWSVFGRLLNSSHWPLILGTDTSSDRKVLKRIRGMSWLSNIVTGLLTVAAAITPLGIRQTIRIVDRDDVLFTYVRDMSPIGQATLERSAYHTNRLCSFEYNYYQNCPGNYNGYTFTLQNRSIHIHSDNNDAYVSSVIASNITGVFEGDREPGIFPDTVASFFDIQYRAFIDWANQTAPGKTEDSVWIDKGQPRTQGRFQYFQNFILNNQIEAVEGLIVATTESPGIGFRNHTLPPTSKNGYTWSEEILWMEPETVCTDLNITLDYSFPKWEAVSDANQAAYITDRGGLLNNPVYLPELDLQATQDNPKLFEKSWTGAVLTNTILLGFLNETQNTTHIGKRFRVGGANGSCGYLYSGTVPNSLAFGPYGYADRDANYWSPELPGALSACTLTVQPPNVSGTEVGNLGLIVSNYSYDTAQSPSRIGLGAGLMQGVGIPLDENDQPKDFSLQVQAKPGTRWSQPFFSCASSVKASARTVRFQIRGHPSIESLEILSVKPSNTTSPIWAVEDTGWPLKYINPLWGPISTADAAHPGISIFQKPQLYLPAGFSTVAHVGLYENDAVAGISGPLDALVSIYGGDTTSYSSVLVGGFASTPDYSGQYSWPLLLEWSRLVRNASSAGRVIDLMWTDLMANMLVGAKSNLPSSDASTAYRPASQYVSVVGYDWKYAALAFIFAALYLVMLIVTLLLWIFKRCNINALRFYLNQTAAGRSVTTERYQAKSGADTGKNEDWAYLRGDEMILVGREDVGESKAHLASLLSRRRQK